jgi:hypothetical protein
MNSKRLKSTPREAGNRYRGGAENWHVGVKQAALHHDGAIATFVLILWCDECGTFRSSTGYDRVIAKLGRAKSSAGTIGANARELLV